MSEVIIVDEKDNIISYKERKSISQKDIYRVSALWIMNSKGDSLLAQRSFNKKNDPGKWGPAVAGTNEKGETYLSNIIKEIEEEIGVVIKDPKEMHKVRVHGKNNYFVQWYLIILDYDLSKFTIQEEEVESIRWISKENFLNEINNPNSKILTSIKNAKEIINLVKRN